MMNKNELQNTALQLKSLLTVLANIDPNTNDLQALESAPIVANIALGYAEQLYCAIMDDNNK